MGDHLEGYESLSNERKDETHFSVMRKNRKKISIGLNKRGKLYIETKFINLHDESSICQI